MKIAIVGAGIMGCTLANFLAKEKFDVSLFEKDQIEQPTNCSSVAAGMIAPFAELSPMLPSFITIGELSIKYWREFIASCNTKVFFDDGGTLCVAHPDYLSHLTRFSETLIQKSSEDFLMVKTSDLEPEINSYFHKGIYLPHEAQVAAEELLQTLIKQLSAYKIEMQSHCQIFEIRSNKLLINNKHDTFDWVIDCRGLGAKEDLPQLKGVRGELYLVHAPQVTIKHVLRVIHQYPIYIIPRPNNQYLIGASCLYSEDLSPVTLRTTLELLSTALSVHAGFSEANLISSRVHVRPTLDSHLPIIQIHNHRHVIRINGLYRHGYLFAPVIAKNIIEFFKNKSWSQSLMPFLQLIT